MSKDFNISQEEIGFPLLLSKLGSCETSMFSPVLMLRGRPIIGLADYRPGRLSAPILSIFTIIDIGHFQNRFADNFYFVFFYYANKLFTGDIIKFLNALFGSMQPV